MTADTKEHDIAALARQLQSATANHAEAHRMTNIARQVETEALKKLNLHQKEFDDAVGAIRSKAHFNSGWSQARNVKEVSQ